MLAGHVLLKFDGPEADLHEGGLGHLGQDLLAEVNREEDGDDANLAVDGVDQIEQLSLAHREDDLGAAVVAATNAVDTTGAVMLAAVLVDVFEDGDIAMGIANIVPNPDIGHGGNLSCVRVHPEVG